MEYTEINQLLRAAFYHCSACHKVFSGAKKLKDHNYQNHEDHMCQVCGATMKYHKLYRHNKQCNWPSLRRSNPLDFNPHAAKRPRLESSDRPQTLEQLMAMFREDVPDFQLICRSLEKPVKTFSLSAFLHAWSQSQHPEEFIGYFHFQRCFAEVIDDLETVPAFKPQWHGLLRAQMEAFCKSKFSSQHQTAVFYLSLALGTTEFVDVTDKDQLVKLIRGKICEKKDVAETIADRFTDFNPAVLILLREGVLQRELDHLKGSIIAILHLFASTKSNEEEFKQCVKALFRLSQKYESFNDNIKGLTDALGNRRCSVDGFCSVLRTSLEHGINIDSDFFSTIPVEQWENQLAAQKSQQVALRVELDFKKELLGLNDMLTEEALEPSAEMEAICQLLEQHVVGFTRIQSQMITMEAVLHLLEEEDQLFVQAHTGTGKTWLVIMTTLYIIRNIQKKAVIITTSNRYLAGRSYNLFRKLFAKLNISVSIDIVAGKVSFVTPGVLASVDNKDGHVLIMDEVDQECFGPIYRRNDKAMKSFFFMPSLHKEFHAMIGFSGSIGGDEEWDALSNLYDDPCLLRIPRLQNRQTPTCLHVDTAEDRKAWLKALMDICDLYIGSEFVIVTLDDDDIPQVEKALRRMDMPTRVINQFNDPTQRIFIEQSLQELMTQDKEQAPIVITNRVGARGVDFRFRDTAIVIVGFLPESMAELIQSIGRSSRNAFQAVRFALCARTSIKLSSSNLFSYYEQINSQQMVNFKQQSLVRAWKLMHEASTIVQSAMRSRVKNEMLTETMMKNWNGMKVWDRHIQEVNMEDVKEELKKFKRIRHLIEK